MPNQPTPDGVGSLPPLAITCDRPVIHRSRRTRLPDVRRPVPLNVAQLRAAAVHEPVSRVGLQALALERGDATAHVIVVVVNVAASAGVSRDGVEAHTRLVLLLRYYGVHARHALRITRVAGDGSRQGRDRRYRRRVHRGAPECLGSADRGPAGAPVDGLSRAAPGGSAPAAQPPPASGPALGLHDAQARIGSKLQDHLVLHIVVLIAAPLLVPPPGSRSGSRSGRGAPRPPAWPSRTAGGSLRDGHGGIVLGLRHGGRSLVAAGVFGGSLRAAHDLLRQLRLQLSGGGDLLFWLLLLLSSVTSTECWRRDSAVLQIHLLGLRRHDAKHRNQGPKRGRHA